MTISSVRMLDAHPKMLDFIASLGGASTAMFAAMKRAAEEPRSLAQGGGSPGADP